MLNICCEPEPDETGRIVLTSSRFIRNLDTDNIPKDKTLEVPNIFDKLDAYFSGISSDIGSFVFRYPPRSTLLQLSVWSGLLKIRYGTSISYKALAHNIGFPNAIRAVASACGANPFQLFIPCHRVIRSDGSIGGFEAGIDVKDFLLKTEKSEFVG